jgi:hypothetical protein
MSLGSEIRDPGSRGKKGPNPGSRIRIRNTVRYAGFLIGKYRTVTCASRCTSSAAKKHLDREGTGELLSLCQLGRGGLEPVRRQQEKCSRLPLNSLTAVP